MMNILIHKVVRTLTYHVKENVRITSLNRIDNKMRLVSHVRPELLDH